jgi:fructose/tagatose bisphosphate aldolase
MALTKFNDLMRDAEKGLYAVGYFESWDLESLQAVADAAEALHSPVLLGFSGIYLHHPERLTRERLSVYAALGNEVCRQISVPACLLFNESPHLERVLEAIDLQRTSRGPAKQVRYTSAAVALQAGCTCGDS